MRIFIYGSRGYAPVVLNSFLRKKENVVGVCAPVACPSIWLKLKKYVADILIRKGLFPRQCFLYKDPFDEMPTLVEVAEKNNIPVLRAAELNTPSFEAALRKLSPELAVVCGFPKLIPMPLAELVKYGVINLHPSLLPQHKGGTPNRWVIRNGDDVTGISAHYITENFDEGPVISSKEIAVYTKDTWGDVERRICEVMPGIACELLNMAREGRLHAIPQDFSKSYYEPPFRGEHQIIDWYQSAISVQRCCNAIRPKSGGLTYLGNRTYCIWETNVLDTLMPERAPGTLMDVDKDGQVIISTGRGSLAVVSFIERGRIVPVKYMLRWRLIRIGQCFNSGVSC